MNPTNVVIPAWRVEAKRQERAARAQSKLIERIWRDAAEKHDIEFVELPAVPFALTDELA